jgi:hypothetical protein
VITDQRLSDFVVPEKLLRLTRILAGDHHNFVTEYAKSTQRDVFQVPNRCRDDVQRASQALAVYR